MKNSELKQLRSEMNSEIISTIGYIRPIIQMISTNKKLPDYPSKAFF
jgi:hypothetical protein